jgi:AraC-like DNA-binding protein
LRAEYTAPWAYESPPSADLTAILRPQAQQLILFHIIEEGECWIRLSSGEQLRASPGEVIILPYGHQHVMGSAESVDPIAIASLLPAPPWKEFPVIRYGGGGTRTNVVCGYLHCDDPLFTPIIGALPPLFSVRPPAGPAAAWITASIQYALDASREHPLPPSSLAVRLPELLFNEVLRQYVESGSPLGAGWLAALRDPIVGPALAALHAAPAHKWTVEELAQRVICSRSTLNERFVRVLGYAPMRYLSDWRFQIARSLLRDTTLSVASVAYQIGYESEEAFNRAFKRAMGKPPAQWRQLVTNH